VLPRKARGHAATRIAPGICVSTGAGADCRQSTEPEPEALSWGGLLARGVGPAIAAQRWADRGAAIQDHPVRRQPPRSLQWPRI